jgi:deoxyribose-phosphate aldolase
MNFQRDTFRLALQHSEQTNINFKEVAKLVLPLIDLASLNATDDDAKIKELCDQAVTQAGAVSSVYVYPSFVKLAKNLLKAKDVKVGTVVNFPNGDEPVKNVIYEIENAISNGADEIDIVWPYKAYLSGFELNAKTFIKSCRSQCDFGNVSLTVILEAGIIKDPEQIFLASCLVADSGADFIKTSTGKINEGSSLEAVASILLAIRSTGLTSVGVKVSGGIKTIYQVAKYFQVIKYLMGSEWISKNTVRFSENNLLTEALEALR